MGGSGGLRDTSVLVILMELGVGIINDRSFLSGGLMEESVCSGECCDFGECAGCLLTLLSSIS